RDLKNLTGTWVIESRASNGRTERPWFFQLQIQGDEMTYSQGRPRPDSTWTFSIDPTKDPKTIDRRKEDHVVLGLYQVEGNRLTLAYSPTGASNRPSELRSRKGSDTTVEVWRRK